MGERRGPDRRCDADDTGPAGHRNLCAGCNHPDAICWKYRKITYIQWKWLQNCIWSHFCYVLVPLPCVFVRFTILLIINAISFVLVIIIKSAYYIAPSGNYLIPDFILIPILILGGATGGIIAKILFNFKEDWSCNATMEFQNFMYNWGVFIVAVVHIGLYFYFFIIR